MEVWILDGIVEERVGVVDISVGGLGLLLDTVPQRSLDAEKLRLRVAFSKDNAFEVDATVRHVSPRWGVCGIQVDPSDEKVAHAFQHAVSELLERASF